eukprot:TRINITY_DN1791_c0_g1_i1.p2 TRINITY_DN1791_c0_g1~~TRINITY_DN1791_c0_g1_i1.p2  ORF type:complete len:359 (-),score=176.50 TRINITY_DN1791_c0_g1_i1:56-1027(-)
MSQKIGTHNGAFHCDEALACFMLRNTLRFKDASVTRTRDPLVLQEMDIVVDVGGVYDPQTLRFDHHQRGFTETFDDKHVTKLSSAGLVYKHFGREVISNVAGLSQEDPRLEVIYQKVYDALIEGIDGIDNGVERYPADVKAAYKVNTDLGSRVGNLNPDWNETGVDVQQRFEKAIKITGKQFTADVLYFTKSWLAAKSIVERSIDSRVRDTGSEQIFKLESHCPWSSHLYDIEREKKISSPILYALYQDPTGSWRIQAVGEEGQNFRQRKGLPSPWRGVRDEELSKVSGVPDCIFIHAGGFIGGGKTYECVLELAKLALAHQE